MARYCKKCNRPSYGWDLCTGCNELRKQGKIVLTRYGWKEVKEGQQIAEDMVYDKKSKLLSNIERYYYHRIKKALPKDTLLFTQVGLSSIIERTDDPEYRSTLNRVLDFLVTDNDFAPLVAIEINDETHNRTERKQRDVSLRGICGEAGLPLIFFSTEYENSVEYISKQIQYAMDMGIKQERKAYIHCVVGSPLEVSRPEADVSNAISVKETLPNNKPLPTIELQKQTKRIVSSADWKTTLLLAIFLGWTGAHRFYAGRIVTGMLYLFTLGLFGIGWIVDVVLVATRRFKDNAGYYVGR